MQYWEPVAGTGGAPRQGLLCFLLQGFLLPPRYVPCFRVLYWQVWCNYICCFCSVQEGNETWKGFTGVIEYWFGGSPLFPRRTCPCWAGHRASCEEERGIQSVKDGDKGFKDQQENGLFIWGQGRWKIWKFG